MYYRYQNQCKNNEKPVENQWKTNGKMDWRDKPDILASCFLNYMHSQGGEKCL